MLSINIAKRVQCALLWWSAFKTNVNNQSKVFLPVFHPSSIVYVFIEGEEDFNQFCLQYNSVINVVPVLVSQCFSLQNYCEKMQIVHVDYILTTMSMYKTLVEPQLKTSNTHLLSTLDCLEVILDNKEEFTESFYSIVHKLQKHYSFQHFYKPSSKDPSKYVKFALLKRCKQSSFVALRRPKVLFEKEEIPKLVIRCINLEDKIERRKFTEEQLNRLGLPYHLVKAINGNLVNVVKDEQSGNRVIHYDDQRIPYNPVHKETCEGMKYDMSYGEMGCALSHIFLYRSLWTNNRTDDYFLILEDDNEILNVNKARSQLYNLPCPTSFDILLLSASMNCEVPLETKIKHDFYSTSSNRFNRTNAFLLTRNGLLKLLQAFDKYGLCLPSDDFLNVANLKVIVAKNKWYKCREDIFASDIWNVYKSNESYTEVKLDKPIYDKHVYIEPGNYARLGNCLFQYAFCKSLSLKYNLLIALPTIEKEIAPFENIDYKVIPPQSLNTDRKVVTEQCFHFDKTIANQINSSENVHLQGYFQSYKYFDKYSKVIENCFEIHPYFKLVAKRLFTYLSAGYSLLCGVHVRMPDVPNDPTFIYQMPSEQYFKEAQQLLHTANQRFIVFSNDINACKERFQHCFPPNTYFSNKSKYIDFALLTLMDNFILTTGTYGWWAAYLRKNKKGKVISMQQQFNPNVNHVKDNCLNDYFPDNWILL